MNLRNHVGLLFVLLSCVWTHTNAKFRIIGGQYINIEKSPHTVAILENYSYFCVGSIVNIKSVLTVAHCVKDENMRNLVVLAGVTDLRAIIRRGGQRRNVEDIHYDCAYDPETFFMDIAIVKVDIPFEPNPAVQIIPLCDDRWEPGLWMQVSGWGRLDINRRTSSPLLKTKSVQIADTQQCRDPYTNTPLSEDFAETIMYAGRSGEDISFGDSGAAGVLNGRLCAVAQSVYTVPGYPVLYTNVTNPRVRNFITTWM